jgi:phage terminase large subunit
MTKPKEKIDVDVTVNKKQYDFLLQNRKRKCHEWGSAGSGKSWSIAQFLIIEKMLKEHDIRIVVTRKTGPALSKSAWLLVQDLLKKYDFPYDINKTDKVIYMGDSNEMYFTPLDDPQKLKSFEKINYFWAEEATELFKNDYMQIGLRCRGINPNGLNCIYFSYNPASAPNNRYLEKISTNPPEDTAVLHTTYHDNAFLDNDYVQEIESLEEMDETYWTIYGLGQWATPKNLIYSNWEVSEKEDFEKAVGLCSHVGYGLDFGFNEPTALVQLGFRERDMWVRELLYERRLTNRQLRDRLDTLIIPEDRRRLIIADCAQPERIEEIQNDGFNCMPCSKGKSSVKIGIDRMKRFKIHIHPESANVIEEFSGYKWIEDFEGNPMDVPVNYRDHSLDATRYYVGEMQWDWEPQLLLVGNLFG